MYIRYHMTSDPISIRPDTTIGQARDILKAHNFRHLPVVDDGRHLIGMVTDRDIRSAYPSSVASSGYQDGLLEEVGNTKVETIMSRDLCTLGPSSTLDDALLLFEHHKVGAIPVIDREGKLVGIFSIRDLIEAYGSIFGLGDKGSTLIEIEDDGSPFVMKTLVDVLFKKGIDFTRLVRLREKGVIFVRVNTFNIRSLLNALKASGLRPLVPIKQI
ncbi:CBS domain protein [Dissulfuribacter thermophilus]|uniref:CBS domain protein n=1 Tax=Dissulfuribacter thermophilus TaxID=1156395 RepID=A0A1B9F3S2_9BACT|nr:CBS domain-containing protein [Dissulfuribacter thermophilus]OCC14576.1 CBS domain protein [Dissulfuribacter thermophilus]